MKFVTLLLVIAMVVFPSNAFASCPTQTGPFTVGFFNYYEFNFDTSCATTSGSVSTASMSCYSLPSYHWDYGTGSVVDYQMTVPINVFSNFSVSVFVDFSDPHSDYQDAISATVIAMHNTTVTHNETIMLHAGNQGSLSCTRFDSGTFSASAGDTIEIVMTGQSSHSDTTMQISTPVVFSVQ